MLKMASESLIHAFLLFLGLFLKISPWVPPEIRLCSQATEINLYPEPYTRACAQSLQITSYPGCSKICQVKRPTEFDAN